MSTRISTGRVRATYAFIKSHPHDVQRRGALSRAGRGAKRLLRVADTASLEPRPRGRPTAAPDSVVVHREPGDLRSSKTVPGPSGGRRDVQQAPGRAAHARTRITRPPRVPHAALVDREAGRCSFQIC